jgi:uncharacterized OsmC-like protein
VVLLRRQGRSIAQPYCVGSATPSADFGDLDPPFNRGGPVALCVHAVGVCYAEELGEALRKNALPWSVIQVQTDAACTDDSTARRLDAVAVFPTIFGGAPSMNSEYAAAAMQARDESVVGRTIRGNVAYKVGVVTVVADDARDALAPSEVTSVGRVGTFPDDLYPSATRHLAAFNRHRHDETVATLHPDCMLEDVAFGSLLRGRTVVVTITEVGGMHSASG